VNNDLFAEHSWYFRNALVRANYRNYAKNIHATNNFLLRFFENLLLGENHILKNREMYVQFVEPTNDPVKAINDPVNDPVKRNILQYLKQNPKANYKELADKTGYSTATIKRHIQELKKMGIIERIGSDKTGRWKIIEH
jgi:predicted HTH transcriptional regulator